MKNAMRYIRTMVGVRGNSMRWIYVVCAAIVLFFCILGSEEGVRGIAHLIAILLLCVIQFFRPTLLGWFILFAGFLAYSVGVLFVLRHGPAENFVFLVLGLLPAVALFFCRPKSV